MAGTTEGRLIVAWNREYLSGTGHESWGILKLSGGMGIFDAEDISLQVFERTIYIFNQRLQGLIVDGDLIHRTWPNGSQTCLAGRGTEARQFSICYVEGGPGSSGLSARSILSIGPAHDFDELQRAIEIERQFLGPFGAAADELIETKRRPLLESPSFMHLRSAIIPPISDSLQYDKINLSAERQRNLEELPPHVTLYWSYEQWIKSGALNESQRRVLSSDALLSHPVRVIGPAGSGKTLLMQLLALRRLHAAKDKDDPLKILYVVHNAAMAVSVSDRFRVLGGEPYLSHPRFSLAITTLADYGRQVTGLSEDMVIDKDAHETKMFQLEQVKTSLREAFQSNEKQVEQSALLKQVNSNEDLFNVFAHLIVAEISNAIKGRGLFDDEKRYVNSEASFSRLHSVLNVSERTVVYDCFKRYHRSIFEQYEILDSDDIAISLLGRLRTPLWELRRKRDGFDFIFVDEAQLFNENERRVFAYLSNAKMRHVPLALALDEAQDVFAFSMAGLATLGITDVESESLPSNHRSTREIVELAFHVIQQTTDLFSIEFPDFGKIEELMISSTHALAEPLSIIRCNEDQPSFGRFILKQVSRMRANNVRQIAIICHAENYWKEIVSVFETSQLPIHIIQQRGEKILPDQPLVIISRPSFIGGQEFDAVISVGLEQGLVPPRVVDNATLAAAIEQQVLRETYLTITRARYRYLVLLNKGSLPNSIIEDARARGLILMQGPPT